MEWSIRDEIDRTWLRGDPQSQCFFGEQLSTEGGRRVNGSFIAATAEILRRRPDSSAAGRKSTRLNSSHAT